MGFVSDLAVEPAHHAGHGDGAAAVGDEQRVLVEGAEHAVEGLHLLAGFGAPDDDGRSIFPRLGLQEVVIEGVQGLAEFQHHVVGDVDDVVDRPHAGPDQPLLHPEGGWPDGDVPDVGGGIAGAQFGIGDLQRQEVGRRRDLRRVSIQHLDDVLLERGVEQGCYLAGDAEDRLQVAERPLDVETQDRVAHVVGQRKAHRGVVRQVDDVDLRLGEP